MAIEEYSRQTEGFSADRTLRKKERAYAKNITEEFELGLFSQRFRLPEANNRIVAFQFSADIEACECDIYFS